MLPLYFVFVIAIIYGQDVEESMTPTEIIAHWGYTVHAHDIVTEDGYIITMLRIPFGRSSKADTNCHRPPVLFVHGILADCAEFVLNPPESSPAMILADAGFDVFMLNIRGTTYSQRHVNLTKDDKDFWKYTVDDMAKYDAPAAIDRALALNGAEALYYIGHSQGTMVSFLMLAERPEYNRKVRAMFEISPTGTEHFTKGLTKVLIWLDKTFHGVYKTYFGPHEIGLHVPWLISGVGRLLCRPFMSYEVCRDIMFLLLGPPAPTFNYTRMPVYLSNFLVSTSTWNVLHWGQHSIRNAVYHFDVSPAENMRRYGQITAPPYNYSNIDTDVYLFWSRNDWLTSPEEIENWLIPKMRPGVIKGTYEVAEYNHVDFAVATDVADRVFNKIIRIMRRNETNYCHEMESPNYPPYFPLISEPFHSTFFALTSTVSVLANLLLIYAIFASKCKEIGNYRYLLLCFALFDILTSVMHFVALPIIHMTSSGYWFLPRNEGIFRTKGGKLAIAITFTYVASYYQAFLILSYHFVYRARKLMRGRSIFDVWEPFHWVVVGVVVNVAYIGAFLRASHTFMAPDYSRSIAPSSFQDLYHVDITDPDIGFFHITWKRENFSTGEMEWHMPTIIAMSASSLLTMGTGAVIGVSIFIITKSIKSPDLTAKTRKLQQQLFKALLIQTGAPILFAYVPLSAIICLPIFGIDGGAFGTVLIMITAVFPLMDAVIVIFFIPRFRVAVRRLFRLPKLTISLTYDDGVQAVRSVSEGSVAQSVKRLPIAS